MTLGFLYGSGDNTMWYILGFLTCVACLVILGFVGAAAEEWEKYKKYKEQQPKQPPSEVVDAHFVNIPRTQLGTSQALVTRRSLERRQK